MRVCKRLGWEGLFSRCWGDPLVEDEVEAAAQAAEGASLARAMHRYISLLLIQRKLHAAQPLIIVLRDCPALVGFGGMEGIQWMESDATSCDAGVLGEARSLKTVANHRDKF